LKKFIYLISPNQVTKNFYKKLDSVLSSNKIKFFQLRLKKYSFEEILEIGKKIKVITDKYNVKLIINDSPHLAKKINADGCHLGQSDMSIEKAKKILKSNKIIGLTCHGSKKLILNSIKYRPNYIALGSFFKSKLKPEAKKADINLIGWSKKNNRIPIVAIGGINNKNYKILLESGANYLAISSFIWNNPRLKPKQALKSFIK